MLSHLAVHSANEGKYLEAPQETINKFRHIVDPNRRTYAGNKTRHCDFPANEIHVNCYSDGIEGG